MQTQTQNQKQCLHKLCCAQPSAGWVQPWISQELNLDELSGVLGTKAISTLRAEIPPKNCRGTPPSGNLFRQFTKRKSCFSENVRLGAWISNLSKYCSRKSALGSSSYLPPSCHIPLGRKLWYQGGTMSQAEVLQSWEADGAFPLGGAGRLRPWKSPLSIVSLAAQSSPPLPPWDFPFYKAVYIASQNCRLCTPASPITLQVTCWFSPWVPSTWVCFQKECLACHPLSDSLVIKTQALAGCSHASSRPNALPLTSPDSAHDVSFA